MASYTDRSYTSGRFAIEFDNKSEGPGWLKSVEGGGIKGELISQQVGGQPWRVKHINNPTVEPVTISMPFSGAGPVLDWVKASWAGACERRNGAITSYNYNFEAITEWSFMDALILETGFPTLDAQSKETAHFTVKFQAESADRTFKSLERRGTIVSKPEQSRWMLNNFEIGIEGLDLKRVSKIDGFTVKQNVKQMTCGPDWMYQIEPTSLEYPNITFYASMIDGESIFAWHKDFVINGNNGPGNEKHGSIVLKSMDLTKDLLEIELKALGIANLSVEKEEVGRDQVSRLKVEIYCEEMSFTVL